MHTPEHARTVLALNLGSTGLKAAVYAVLRDASAPPALREIARTQVDTAGVHGSPDAAGDQLARAMRRCPGFDVPGTVVHRIVHGGDRTDPVELTPSTVRALTALAPWAPLHQPPALQMVEAARARWPHARQLGMFDSAWHRTMPEQHRVLALPASLRPHGVRRYGFHGLAFQSVMRQLGDVAPGLAHGRVVLAHLGGGSSLCAVLDGRSVNTTMGLTPLGGIPMATRSGSLDPGVLLHAQRALGMSPDAVEHLLWKECGLKGISQESGDMRVLLASASAGARLAVEVYVSAVAQGVAAMAACIGGLDALAFSGGIGTNAPEIRSRVLRALAWLGLEADDVAPADARPGAVPPHRPRVFVLGTDEERELAIAALAAPDGSGSGR